MVNLDLTKEVLYEALGVSEKRVEEIMSHEFCGIIGDHTSFQHIKAVLDRPDLTEAERLIFMYGMGHKAALSDVIDTALLQARSVQQLPQGIIH